MSEAEAYFDWLCQEIPDLKAGKMFGAKCMKTPNGKSAAMFWKDNIVVKLGESALNDALRLTDSCLFEPMEGRPMKEWVQVSFNHKDKWKELVLRSMQSIL